MKNKNKYPILTAETQKKSKNSQNRAALLRKENYFPVFRLRGSTCCSDSKTPFMLPVFIYLCQNPQHGQLK